MASNVSVVRQGSIVGDIVVSGTLDANEEYTLITTRDFKGTFTIDGLSEKASTLQLYISHDDGTTWTKHTRTVSASDASLDAGYTYRINSSRGMMPLFKYTLLDTSASTNNFRVSMCRIFSAIQF